MTAASAATTRVLETIFPLSAMPAERSDRDRIKTVTEPATSFAELGVPAPLVDVLDADGITAPFPVQAAVAARRAGRPGHPRPGTHRLRQDPRLLAPPGQPAGRRVDRERAGPRGLVLVPTRELATQVTEVLKPLARAMDLWVTTIYGGVSYGPQVNALQPQDRHRRRHPRPARRPDRAGRVRPVRRRGHGHRRGGPDGRPRLPADRPAAARDHAGRRPADAVLRHARRRRRRARAALPAATRCCTRWTRTPPPPRSSTTCSP